MERLNFTEMFCGKENTISESETEKEPTVLYNLIKGRDWDGVLSRVISKVGKEESKICDSRGNLPIHHAAERGAPLNVIRTLLNAHPKAAETTNKDDDLALHIACENGFLDGVVGLLEANPNGATKRAMFKHLPLHLPRGVLETADVDIVKALLEAHPQGAKASRYDGELPLHCSCIRRDPVEVVRALLKANPQGASTITAYGDLPLHLALLHGASVEVVRALLEEYPQAARKIGNMGELPLQLEYNHRRRSEVIALLIDVFPDAVRLPCTGRRGACPPWSARMFQNDEEE